jgi:universal stress protein A
VSTERAAATPGRADALGLDPILVPCDFSPATPGAVHAGTALARLFGAGLVALHVTPLRLPASGGFHALPNPVLLRPRLHDDVSRALAGAIEAARADGVAARTEQREGKPADEILAAGRVIGAGFIVVGTHGRRAVGRALLGSVAETILRRAGCPVLAVPPDFVPSPGWPRTVLSTSRSPAAADAALAYASAIAGRAGAELVSGHGVDAAVLQLARRRGADLVVVGVSRPALVRRFVGRATLLHVIRHATCPVLVVRPGPARA